MDAFLHITERDTLLWKIDKDYARNRSINCIR